MSDSKVLITKNNGYKILDNLYKKSIYLLKRKISIPTFLIIIGIVIIFLIPCLISSRKDFVNEIEEVTQAPLEPEKEKIDLIKEPNTEKTYENTSLPNTPSSDFEILKNFHILDTNKIISVKEKINDYSNQPTFSPGKFN